MNLERQYAGYGCLLFLVAAAPLLLQCTYKPDMTTSAGRATFFEHRNPREAKFEYSGGGGRKPDTAPPTQPSNFRVNTTPVPIVQAVQGYINRTFLTAHTTEPFDSSDGDLIVVCASSHAGVRLTPSDSFGNTWISVAGPTNTTTLMALRTQVWYAKNPAVGPGHTLTINLSAAQSLVISVLVVRGSDIAAPIDAFSLISDDGNSRTFQATSPDLTTTNGNDLLIGFAKSSTSESFTPGDGFTVQPLASSDFLAAESRLAGTAGTHHATFALTAAATWQSIVVAVKPSPIPSSLAWAASTDNVGVAGYSLERCQGVGCRNFKQMAALSGTTFSDMGLGTDTSYSYRVRARDAAGNVSRYSKVLRVGQQARPGWRAASSSRHSHPG
jgi:hypothetical protein